MKLSVLLLPITGIIAIHVSMGDTDRNNELRAEITKKGQLCVHIGKTTMKLLDECKEAAIEWGKSFKEEGSWRGAPKGCMLYNNEVSWNKSKFGTRHIDVQSICSKNGCQDEQDNCQTWAIPTYSCDDDLTSTKIYCRKSCGLCEEETCIDGIEV